MIRGKVRVGKLVQPTLCAGSPSSLRFKDGKVIDAAGDEVRTEPLREAARTRPARKGRKT